MTLLLILYMSMASFIFPCSKHIFSVSNSAFWLCQGGLVLLVYIMGDFGPKWWTCTYAYVLRIASWPFLEGNDMGGSAVDVSSFTVLNVFYVIFKVNCAYMKILDSVSCPFQ